jgi:hypothetical protein
MPSFNRKRVENNFMSGDLEQSAYTADSGNAVENTVVDTAAAGGVGNVMPGVWQVPVAIPVALPVAIPVKELVSRVSLRLILLSGGSFLLGYLILPLIGMMFIRQPDGAAAGVLSLVCPFFSIAALLAGGWLQKDGKLQPVEQITVAGNFFTLLKEVEEVGSDLWLGIPQGSIVASPSLKIRGLMVSGS